MKPHRPPRNEQADSKHVQSGWHTWLKKKSNRNIRRYAKEMIREGREDEIPPNLNNRYFGYET